MGSLIKSRAKHLQHLFGALAADSEWKMPNTLAVPYFLQARGGDWWTELW